MRVQFSYMGLKASADGAQTGTPKSPEMLANEFATSVRVCLKGARLPRWKRALQVLEADPIFKEAEIASLADGDLSPGALEGTAIPLFRKKLSSGHKIVLLSITRLVEAVDEKTLVLLDEPEAHLHP